MLPRALSRKMLRVTLPDVSVPALLKLSGCLTLMMRSPRPAPGRKHRARPIVPLQRGDEPEHRAAEAKGYQKKGAGGSLEEIRICRDRDGRDGSASGWEPDIAQQNSTPEWRWCGR